MAFKTNSRSILLTSSQATLRLMGIVFTLLILIFKSSAIEAKPVSVIARKLTLSFETDQADDGSELESSWQNFCVIFAKQFEIGKGPQGRGLFKEASCQAIVHPPRKTLRPLGPGDWRFTLKKLAGKTSLIVHYAAKASPIVTVQLPRAITPHLLFSNSYAVQYLVAQVYRRLPAAWVIKLPMSATEWTLPAFKKNLMPGERPVSHAVFFHLSFNSKEVVWIPYSLALAKIDNTLERKEEASDSANAHLTLRPLISTAPNSKRTVWAQELFSDDGDESAPELFNILNAMTTVESAGLSPDVEDENFLSSFRYLSPFPKTDSGISKAAKIEFILRLKNGWLNGLSLGIEKSQPPPVSAAAPYPFKWLRSRAAWDIGLGLNKKNDSLSSELRIAPRIGLLSLDTKIVKATNALLEPDVLYFHGNNQLELGGEITWQLKYNAYTLSLYGMANVSGIPSRKAGEVQTSDLQTGTILHYGSPLSLLGINLGFEALAYFERLTLNQEGSRWVEKPLQLADSSVSANDVKVTIFYIGLGMVLSW